MFDEPKIGEKPPHSHPRRREDCQAHRRGYLSRRRPGRVGTGIRRPPVLVSMHEPPQIPRLGELPQKRGHAIGAIGQAATIAGEISRPVVSRYGGRQRPHSACDCADRAPDFESVGKPVADHGI